MVLHNDKWKYKAKRNVERKHAMQNKRKGIKSNEDQTKENQLYDSESNHSNNTTSDNNDSDDSDDEEKKFKKSNKKTSNSWRFADPIIDESILKDPEYIAQLESKRQEEENRTNYMRSIVAEKLKDSKHLDLSVNNPKTVTSLKKLKNSDLENWRFDSDIENEDHNGNGNNNENNKTKRPEIREFTEEEREKFLQLQKRINHQKEVEKIRNRMDKLNNKLPMQKNKILELNSKVGADNYRGIVDKRLEIIDHDKTDRKELDDLVCQMNGIDLKHDQKDNPNKIVSDFNLESLMKSPPLPPPPSSTTSSLPSATTPKQSQTSIVLDNPELDDFLDSIL